MVLMESLIIVPISPALLKWHHRFLPGACFHSGRLGGVLIGHMG